MSKKIIRKNTSKKILYTEKYRGETLKCRSTKTCIGSPLDGNGGKCRRCILADSDLALICYTRAGFNKRVPQRVPKKRKKGSRPFEFVVSSLHQQTDRKEIVSALVMGGAKETSSKSFVASVACVMGAISGQSRKPEGLVNQYIIWLQGGSVGAAPIGDSSSIAYCNAVYNTYCTYCT